MPLATAPQSPVNLPTSLNDPAAMVFVGLGVMVLVYLMVLRPQANKSKQRKNRGDPLATPPSQQRSLSAERSAERQMQTLLIELERMARTLTAQLDTRAAKLEALVNEADEKLSALNAALARDKAGAIADRLSRDDETGDRPARLEAKMDAGGLAALASHRAIYDLADAGDAAPSIAQKLNRPAGEVELILALRSTGGAIG